MLVSFKSEKTVIEKRPMGIISCALQGWEKKQSLQNGQIGERENEARAEMECLNQVRNSSEVNLLTLACNHKL